GPDMPLLAHMLHPREPTFEQAQQQDVSQPPPSTVVTPHPLPDPMPSPPRQSSPLPIPFVLETITPPFRDDDTGGGSFHESLPCPHPATLTISPTIGGQSVLFAKRIKKLERKLKTKKRKLVLSDLENEEEERQSKELDALLDLANAALHEPSLSTTHSKLALEQSLEQEISPTTLDAVLTLSQSKARARAAIIIYKHLKKKKSSFGFDFMDVDIPVGGLDSAGGLVSVDGVDSAGVLTSAGILVAAGPTVLAEPSSPLRDPFKGKAVANPSSPITAPTDKELADQQAAILEAERQELLEQELKQNIDAEQIYLDSLLAQRVAKEHDSENMASAVQSTQRQAKLDKSSAIYTTGWTWKFVRGLTDDQLWIKYDKIRRVVDLATTKDQHQHLKRSGETLGSLESKKLKSSHSTSQPAELQETTSVFAGATIAVGDPILAVTSVSAGFSISAAFSIHAVTPIAAGVSTTAGAFGSASEASVPIIELLDSPPKDASLPLDPETEEHDAYLRKSLRKKSIAKKRTLPGPSKPKSDALPFDKNDPEAAFKRADGTVKRFSTLRELMYWAGRADLMVLYGLVLDKYKTKRATSIGLAGDIMYMFVDKKYPLTPATLQRMLNHGLEIDRDLSGNDLTTAIQLIQSLLNQVNPAA
nr:hypothetical protein [Tanacetum cinerariifolium]